jgi:hypothetical protein
MLNGVIDWLNENALRAYPFKENITRSTSNSTGYRLTDSVILDAQFVYTTLPLDTSLVAIEVIGDDVGIYISDFEFIVNKTDDYPIYKRIPDGSLLVLGAGLLDIPEGVHLFADAKFEPSVSLEFGNAWLGVSSLQFGADNLVGNINLIEGYQFGITTNAQQFTFDAGRSFGVPISCARFKDYPEDCANIVSSLNGVDPDGNHNLLIRGGDGIVVLDDPANHRIYIGLSFNPSDVCRDIVANPAQ